MYDVGLGFASDVYYDDAYGCDPYGGSDAYYNCDYGQAFSDIGFGGGWYDNYYYSGYGFLLFDNIGRLQPMSDRYRRYWSAKRQYWYCENRGCHQVDGSPEGLGNHFSGKAPPGTRGWPKRDGGRVHYWESNPRGCSDSQDQYRRARDDQLRGGDGKDTELCQLPIPKSYKVADAIAAMAMAGSRATTDKVARIGGAAKAAPMQCRRHSRTDPLYW